jgi:isoleucyl-tRNA synthetase
MQRHQVSKETDILDVWFESGAAIWPVLGHEPGYPWPADLYLEGGDQYRGWFQSSLLCAMGTPRQAAYRGVVTNGWTLDEKGQAMSKSRGNDVDPVDIANRWAARSCASGSPRSISAKTWLAPKQLMQRVARTIARFATACSATC